MRVVSLVCAVVAVVSGSKISTLKESITTKTSMMSKLGSVGPFKLINNDILAKVSKHGEPVDLPISRQRGAWNMVEGNSMIEAWAVSEQGLVIKQKDQTVNCGAKKGMDNQNGVAISYTCMLEGQALLHEPGWPIKTGYDALHDQENAVPTKLDDEDETTEWDPRVRFWHRCAGGAHNGLSLCNRYRFVGADAQGYYGCDYMTQDSYCVQSYRHEWQEYNPNDLPFVFNPESPCKNKPCLH